MTSVTNSGPIVVVGAGAAGLATVKGVRANGFTGQLTWVGAEPELPYDRPPLSKGILTGTWEPDRVRLCDAAGLADLDVDLRVGATATGADLAERVVSLADGTRLPFGTLVIATGVDPRSLPGTSGLRGVHTLRTLADATALRAELGPGRRLVVIGAGFLGTELAAAARTLGTEVHLVEPAPVPLAAAVGVEVGTMLAALHRDRGVSVRTGPGAAVTELTARDGAVDRVVLADGSTITADVVVVAIGSVPATGWLAGSGLDCSDGVRCDQFCAAAPGVYAVGDVASWYHPGFATQVRLEHRTNAGEQGLYVARAVLGRTDEPFTPVPYFWSDQYDLKIQAFGLLRDHDEVRVVDGAIEDGEFVALYRRGTRLAGVLGVRKVRALRQWQARIKSGSSWADALAAA
ncbi:Reductase C-terminal [Goodfellowiella coeruleoviolacea]|uniref:Reductase C-terminal n=1 Tax=Goodfellowiella coeruleoviolacea TaxID=334858 RepID=A0AAE3GBC5_9PSEU|nr:Reductase C-terminal [Goodfellowiella coeruleoviolacea]